MLPPGNTVILLYDGGKRVATKAPKFASKLDFSAEALVAYPGIRSPGLINQDQSVRV